MFRLLDTTLNRLILALLGVLLLFALFHDGSGNPSRRGYQGTPDASELISLMNTPCYQLDERLAFLRACVRPDRPEGDDETDCPAVAPLGVNYEPPTVTMADLLIRQLEERQASYACRDVLAEPADFISQSENDEDDQN